MKVTNISTTARVYLQDCRVDNPVSAGVRRGEDRYLGPGASMYLPNTSQVLRSAVAGDIRGFVDQGILQIEDIVDLAATGNPGDSVVLNHQFHFPPSVVVFKQVGATWVDATGTVDVVHDEDFLNTTITNTTAFALTFLIRLL